MKKNEKTMSFRGGNDPGLGPYVKSGAASSRLAHILAIGYQRAEEAKKASSPAAGTKPESVVGKAFVGEWEREATESGLGPWGRG